MLNKLVSIIFGSLVLWAVATYFLFLSQQSVGKDHEKDKLSNQISRLEKQVKQQIIINQELLEGINESKRRKKEHHKSNVQLPEKEVEKDKYKKDEVTRTKNILLQKIEDTNKWENSKTEQKSTYNTILSTESIYSTPSRHKLPDGSPIIAILVVSCNRVTVGRCLDQLIKLRPNKEQFPIVVSQDCDHRQTAEVIARYGNELLHVKQPDQSDIEIPPKEKKFRGYFKIARHYKWALNKVFVNLGYSTAIIVEDDLDIAPDFYEYFLGTYPLLVNDTSLWCVSAWNDNGKAGLVDEHAPHLLYRTDFFPGLGWMLTRDLWLELAPKWPKSYWDDWIRQPEQRKNRACIRPEISRTRTFGKLGVSNGLFFEKHLKYIKLNEQFVPFTKMNLSYLLKDNYDIAFVNQVYQSTVVSYLELKSGNILAPGPVRIPYYTRQSFKNTTKLLGLMDDFRSGVPRSGYRGVVTFFYNGRRVHLAPSANWSGYDITWS
ncbi:alpha-1,3-mannosyl-glycoprotein 2-beta-N-acetylglucosaminyltransferase [Pseudomyrmex gracilis]|uniref:alpha-1,3-mannosyl-glycoprotein 2-beta-N-acetylglucosaminyltransferase n=1 Tax=Pseudomyrmex gracilis TaxID=219809 RepID=UPI0009957E04|nr:alpha-1,3-mannosyl-glycoprotein 2-beta-N-acetylglucosaminyltransferase [Pseudomyrmex gracilis]XP_020280162.1 alpha-1,3-mannosyl-glycoprotein 2-beta-N-acetylglucosaminyltransferase [Pseudomyrmex gracilis]XP_020280163.1 alpha-1,3-mannosyl-glycoprotein 2-beta-N-acetylglucosaminyltransferase [Pseudomyrmex gracilis]XP_020280164.1 alpha-1,3-mannosyl-glycoprotein 2-beta-N-acetylglucosaminyltransferase [Pseudomyrmex gracilis]XP_020280165.1 alpha-1,3-mannosyl-glycoprotein 2-beta-N-acetylglucosaminylt